MKYTYLKFGFVFLLFLITFSCSDSEEDAIIETSIELPNETSKEDEILRLVNVHRQSLNLSIIEKNETAQKLAIDHSKYMIMQGQISHDNVDFKFQTLQEKEDARSFAENVAFGQPSAQAVMEGWLNSSGHRRNIEGEYSYIGIGAVKDSNGRYYYTQVFFSR